MKFSATYQREGVWWIGYVAELPGANVQERTLEEARESLREAAKLIVAVNREITDRMAAERDVDGGQAVREELLVAV